MIHDTCKIVYQSICENHASDKVDYIMLHKDYFYFHCDMLSLKAITDKLHSHKQSLI